MACYRPLQAWQRPGGGRLSFQAVPGRKFLELPCGNCIGCFVDRGLLWKTRIVHESMCWDQNLFLTLSYSPEKLPESRGLEYSDFQAFMKRLRAHGVEADWPRPIRFFVAGEYGEETHRPHFHAVLFNCSFPDARWWTRKGFRVARSAKADALWSNGSVDIGVLNSRTAGYVAGYVKARKRCVNLVDRKTGEIFERRPEFQRMSNRPGIGSAWYDRWGGDLFPLDGAVVDGRVHKVPRYYLDKRKREASRYPELLWGDIVAIRDKRVARAQELPPEESSLERLAVREEAVLLRESHFRRGL